MTTILHKSGPQPWEANKKTSSSNKPPYAIMIEFDNDEWMYVCEGSQWQESKDNPVLYDTYEEALEASKVWNNPRIVSYHIPAADRG